ncbi:class C sortase [Xylanimonas ulmi]|uniref:Sortase A n=1 Tax=Xylanimonas ulmi TaxID=228973 RepID=A0A4Q7M3Y0_9MICO|nr:class C sortase [Xylanibacterium ulmi]RZS62655.1 sortase A [Xylanibacterium ulmi]
MATRSRARRRSWTALVGVTLGSGLLFYPAASGWFSAWAHGAEVTDYVESVSRLPVPEKADELRSAREFNANLAGMPLEDPYAGAQIDADAWGVQEYLGQLDDTEVMARVRIPEIDADLPIYHGTSEQTLARGVGHLFGSALPVGGSGTHAVLTGHSGMVGVRVFDDLHDLRIGDQFTISVLDEVLTYEVDQILTVEPTDIEALRPVAGQDYVTLVTCTPIGVNSHRLLVRGVRVQAQAALDPVTTTAPAVGASPGFPWWALGALGVPAAFAAGAWRHEVWRSRRRRPIPA